jgi:glycogen debranching enzyme
MKKYVTSFNIVCYAAMLLLCGCMSDKVIRSEMKNPEQFNREIVPEPVCDEYQNFIELYYYAWESAWNHIDELAGMPSGNYMDEAFDKNNNWIWDTCFMAHFCKYSPDFFPGIESLDNFYKAIHDGVQLPVAIHIIDNPPLFAWTEYEYLKFTGDMNRIKRVVSQKNYLQKHYMLLENLKEQQQFPATGSVNSCLIKTEDGYFWEGGRSGMDNTPRGRSGIRTTKERPNNQDLLWIDALAQQGLSALYISKLAELVDNTAEAQDWNSVYKETSNLINTKYWDKADNFYYDIFDSSKEFCKVPTPASYWPMLAGMCSQQQAEELHKKTMDSNWFGGDVPWKTLAPFDRNYNSKTGDYWRGSLWLPTAYMGIKALQKYNYLDSAAEQSKAILTHMDRTFREFTPETIWECYNPEKPEPARHGKEYVRADFCGWSALGPISLFIENILGFYEVNALTNTVKWNLNLNTRHGIKGLKFGSTECNIIYNENVINVESNKDFFLYVNGKKFNISKGSNNIPFLK